MTDLQFVFTDTSLNTIFPFYILIDENLTIKSFGNSIAKMMPDLEEDKLFTDYFTVIRPFKENVNPKNFKTLLHKSIIFTFKGFNSLTLKGQFERQNSSFLFLGSPWFMSLEEVSQKKLEPSDFAFHDSLLDILHVLKNQEKNNNELKRLIKTIDEQSKQLKIDKEELNRLSLVASANKNGVVFTQPQGEIFWCNEAFANLTGYSQNEIIGKSIIEVGRGKLSNKKEIYKMVEAFYKGNAFDVEYVYVKKQGGTFRSKITGQPILDSKGFVSQYFAIIEDITIEKEREEQLVLLSSIAEKNSNPVFISDKDGKIEWVNSSFLELTEYNLEEIIGERPDTLLHGPETNLKTVNYLNEQIKNGLPFNCEIINYTKFKQEYWVRIQGQALHDEYGKIKKYFTIQEDISLEKEFSQQLIESQNRLNSLIANLQSGILFEDENKKILLANSKFCSLFKIEADPDLLKGFDSELIAVGIKDFFKDPNQFKDRLTEILNQKEIVIAETIELADGRVLERSFIPIYKGEKLDGNLWSYEDVTIKKKYRESLEAEREKYSNIIANMNMGLLEVDNNDIIKLANQSFLEMSGFKMEELIGHKTSELFVDPQNKLLLRDKIKDRTIGLSNSYEIIINTKEGKEKYWLISGAPNYNVNGEVIGSIGIHLDITEQKKLELQKEQLLKRLEIKNERLNEYAHMVSHDLKSPLRSIHSLITWIKDDNKDLFNETTVQYFELIEDKVEKMDNLIQGILTYSKVDSSKELTEKIDLNEIITNIIQIIHIPENVTVTIKKELPILETDRFRMQQLFQNIISNAVNYIDKKEGFVEIDYEEIGNDFVFSIKDNGQGIDTKYQVKIFDLFQSFSEEAKSTGIGLTIVKRIVDNYNGTIWLESSLGIGTTFFIKLPKGHGKT
ncbi:PAS domain-containing protein [Flavobacterium sangjuense]|uniref:Adaptive-response sensory-kinase SasA n=1 Tax=Flavobacterium sangjuense TaxID=2518177 RepID=A0A4P7PPL5_9FLAO|nr:PAS domain-containing protein [Flavobacterium sangjuense]QBZ96588.1 Adaptive-response sensory-kinase SasA [Flavobacterium sangjuense]